MNKSVKSTIALIFVGIIFIACFFVMGIMDLVNTKDIQSVSVSGAFELLEVENSINGLIPTGTDYYYLGFDAENEKLYTIHADSNWLEKNFDADGVALNSDGVSIKGLVKRAGDYDVEKELESRIAQIEEISSGLGFGEVIEINYVRDAVLRIVAGVVLMIVVGFGAIFIKSGNAFSRAGKIVYGIIGVGALIFGLITIL